MSGSRTACLALNEQNNLVLNRSIAKTHWIELDIRDEHNKPFTDITGILTDSTGMPHDIIFNGQPPVRVDGLPPGKVTFEFECDEWLLLAQTRKSRTEYESPVEAYAADNTGFNCSHKQYFKVASGNLTKDPEKEILQIWHQEYDDLDQYYQNNKGEINLDVNNSFVIEVKGFNYLTMRLGMFFDGTTNNTYSAEWGKTVLDDYSGDWVDKYEDWVGEPEDLRNKDPKTFANELFEFPSEDSLWFDKAVTGSAANEITNVEKMKRLYLSGEIIKNVYIDRLYVTGIGTGNDTDSTQPADEPAFTGVLMGQGLGGGPYGILKKVTTAIESIGSNLKSYLNRANDFSRHSDPRVEYDGIGKFEFDVFGFSRGSAAARHFINVVLDGEDGDFAKHIKKICEDDDIILDPAFKWTETEKDKLIIKFAGLFDTVASVLDISENDWSINNDDTGDVRLWLDPEGVEKAVHLTAHKKTEYRKNFCSNKLNLVENQFEEHELPGAHSDLGGGYHSINSFEDKSYYLPLLENKLVFETWEDHKNPTKEGVNKLLSDEVDRLKGEDNENGWGDIYKREIHLHTDYDHPERSRWHGKLFVKRAVKGDLSRLYLRVMHGLAYKHNVPLVHESQMWKRDEHLITGSFDYKYGSLEQIAEEAYGEALKGKVLGLLKTEDFRKALVGQSFVHHSADLGVANVADGELERKAFECAKGS